MSLTDTAAGPPTSDDPAPPVRSPRLQLLLWSALMLFTELALIRWAGANILYLSYFSNLVLLGSFLGIGVGFLWVGRGGRPLFGYAPIALLGLVAFIRFFPVGVNVSGNDVLFLGELHRTGPPREVVLPLIFLAVATTLAFIADGVARAFGQFEPLRAYKLDLTGSILGIIGFTLISFLWLPPVAWGVVVAVITFVLLPARWDRRRVLGLAALLVMVGLLGGESLHDRTLWSSYYKIDWEPGFGGYGVKVNGVPHQNAVPAKDNPLYKATYAHQVKVPKDQVLIIGAGGGNDVSVALANGAGHVDAIEIDRRLYHLGRDHHPDAPYADPRVDVHIDDGRAYLERSSQRWDRIQLALPDSLTLVTGQSSVRLESYLFTKEAAEAYRDHLKAGGAFSMYNFYRERWLVDRYAATLYEVFGTRPCVVTLGSDFTFAVLQVSTDPQAIDCQGEGYTLWEPNGATPVADDRPFPYLRERTIPAFYVVTLLLILAVSAAAVVLVTGGGPVGTFRALAGSIDLFFMGAAFALLETKNVVQFALLFGTTWLVNALVFLGVLLSVLAAVLLSERVTLRRPRLLYLLLLAALAVAYAVPQHMLLELSPAPRFAVAVTLAFLPIFTANLVFSQRFKGEEQPVTAFGANLLGTMVGGTIEYISLVTGYRFLLLVVGVLYGAAYFSGRAWLSPRPAEQDVLEPTPV